MESQAGGSAMPARVAFIGLGVMGYPMAGHLARAGHHVTVFNRTTAKAERWVSEHGGRFAATPASAAEGADAVLSCVGRDFDLREVTLGANGAFAFMRKDAVFIDPPPRPAGNPGGVASAAGQSGFAFVDAPVSGGEQ